MIGLLATASGGDAAQALVRAARADPAVTCVRSQDLAVAYRAGPFVSAHDDGDVLVVVDGALHQRAHARGTGDAEQLLHRWRERGLQLADGLLGDHVLVVLDRAAGTLLVARDPVGVRPWYLTGRGERHAGATDLRTLLDLPWVDPALDERTTVEFLATVTRSQGRSFYRDIGTLPPATAWRQVRGSVSTAPTWTWQVPPETDLSWDDAAQRCRDLLDEAVRSRLTDRPATSQLSGGLDSSTVVGTLVRLGRADTAAARLVFAGPDADERSYSDAVAEHWGVPLLSAPPELLDGQAEAELVRRIRRPVPDANFTMFLSLHRLLLEHGRPTGLTGLGGDDAFVAQPLASRLLSAVQLRQGSVLAPVLRRAVRHPHWAYRQVLRPVLRHLHPRRGDSPPAYVAPRAAEAAGLPELFRARPSRVTGVAAVDSRLHGLTSGYDAFILEAAALVQDSVGRRESHPFLDPRFVQGTYGLDPSWPLRDGHYRALQAAAYADRVPEVVRLRQTKAHFAEVVWPQLQGAESVLTGPLRDRGWLDPDGFRALVDAARRGRANAALPLARCLSTDHWLRSV
ncbi:MAG: hypothetical protein JWN57_1245 [Frankiales bacterium]|nr:hypothetical protein [Frankiales bacterium]